MKRKLWAVMMAGVMTMAALGGCGSDSAGSPDEAKGEETAKTAETSESSDVLRVGMECAYAPFNVERHFLIAGDDAVASN